MEKDSIAQLIEEKHHKLLIWLKQQPDEMWESGPKDKWTTGQHAVHLLKSLELLNKALSMPKFLLRFKFGKTNRELRDFETVIQRYQERLKNVPGKTFKGSAPSTIPKTEDKTYFLGRFQVEYKKLAYKTRHISDKNLNNIVLPHPLMGKMPIREILMWSAYHVEHHNQTLENNYNS